MMRSESGYYVCTRAREKYKVRTEILQTENVVAEMDP